jgi:predicted nucleic acid-binding protein
VILVDSSVWIDFLRGTRTAEADTLSGLIGKAPLLVGDLMLCEILLGVPTEAEARRVETALRRFEIVAIVSDAVAVQAAAHYRALRARGITIRKTIDLLIGAFCLRHRHTLLHRDRDFDPMQTHLGLRVLAP